MCNSSKNLFTNLRNLFERGGDDGRACGGPPASRKQINN
jgi:hypothetical protein